MAHREPLQGGVSDDCVLSGVTSSSRSLWPSQQPSHHNAGPSKKKVVERREEQEEEYEAHVALDGRARLGELPPHARAEAFDDEDVHDPFRSRDRRHT